MEEKNWAQVRELVGYLRYDTVAALEKLNEIWELDRVFTNYLLPQQKLIENTGTAPKSPRNTTHQPRPTSHAPPARDPAREDA